MHVRGAAPPPAEAHLGAARNARPAPRPRADRVDRHRGPEEGRSPPAQTGGSRRAAERPPGRGRREAAEAARAPVRGAGTVRTGWMGRAGARARGVEAFRPAEAGRPVQALRPAEGGRPAEAFGSAEAGGPPTRSGPPKRGSGRPQRPPPPPGKGWPGRPPPSSSSGARLAESRPEVLIHGLGQEHEDPATFAPQHPVPGA